MLKPLEEKISETILATAAHYLISRNQNKAVVILLSSQLTVSEVYHFNSYDEDYYHATICDEDQYYSLHGAVLLTPVELMDSITLDGRLQEEIRLAIELSIPVLREEQPFLSPNHFHARPHPINVDQDWRTELLKVIEGEKALNQASFIKKESEVVLWNTMRFASLEEMQIAKALEKISEILYVPNCLTRLIGEGKKQIAPDFLVRYQGKWAVLEVDGGQHNHPGKSESDKSRDRELAKFGLNTYRYPASRCAEDPEGVVRDFLKILKQN